MNLESDDKFTFANSLTRISQRTVTLIGIHLQSHAYRRMKQTRILSSTFLPVATILSATTGTNVRCDLRVSRLKSVA